MYLNTYSKYLAPDLAELSYEFGPSCLINLAELSYLSIYLHILPHALADILGSCALSSNVSRKRKKSMIVKGNKR